jgi:amino acid adenylation domain-containing protein
VGIVTHDHLDTYAAIWAIWLAGKSYVPFNPSNPKDLNDRIVNQLDLDLILDAHETSGIADGDNSWLELSEQDFDDARVVYVLFTSGSTGVPKGVPISAANLAGFVEAFWAMGYEITQEDRALQMFELTFDLSVMSYLVTVLKGGCIFTVPKDTMKFAYIFELLTEQEITVALMVPSMLKLLRPYFDEIDCPKLRYSLFCGEALDGELVTEWAKCIPNARIDNVYGPTENTIFCTYYTYQSQEAMDTHNGVLSIGKPMLNNYSKVFNDMDKLAGFNEVGELALAGTQLTAGYLNNEELNGKAFFEFDDPQEGKRIRYYRTGDLCYQLPNGNLNYVGRKDAQVKIQGFRVELSEIEFQAKAALGGFKNLVCITQEDRNHNNEIFLVIEGEAFDTASLVSNMKEKLPWYMMPKEIVFMLALPLNTSGKIDKKQIKAKLSKVEYTIRSGEMTDIPFLVECIIAAEKGNSEVVGLSKIFNLNNEELRTNLQRMLEEEIEGCEFSVTNFVIAETAGKPVAALCAWLEGINEYDQPSSVLKSNLLNRTLGSAKVLEMQKHKQALEQIRLTRLPESHQVEYVFVDAAHRGQSLVQRMIEYSLEKLPVNREKNLVSQIEVFANNTAAIKAYSKLGYEPHAVASVDPALSEGVFPHFEKVQLTKVYTYGNQN